MSRQSVEREIEIYRETLKIAKTFTPDDLEDMSLLKRVQEGAAQGCENRRRLIKKNGFQPRSDS